MNRSSSTSPTRRPTLLLAAPHRPAVAVRVREEAEAAPRDLLNFGDLDAARPQERVNFVDVFDDKLCSLHRARFRLDPSFADRYAACRPRRCETYEAAVALRAYVHVGVEAESVDVERLGAIDVGDRNSDQFKTENHEHLLDRSEAQCGAAQPSRKPRQLRSSQMEHFQMRNRRTIRCPLTPFRTIRAQVVPVELP